MNTPSKKILPIVGKKVSASVPHKKPAARKAVAKPIAQARGVGKNKQVTAGSSVAPSTAGYERITSGDNYTVYRSPLEPVHLTREQIAAAVAKVRGDR